MKITHNKVGQNLNVSDTKKSDDAKKSGAAGNAKADALLNAQEATASSVNVSQRAQDAKKAKEIAMKTPDVREDRVAALQKMIDEGKYNVSAKDIADKMVDEEMQWR
ncbi:MAG: flagellar biosynthesis anti-sigma factor FlgM [Proteobacteria bacterium]|jgi:negative regulator of flagellin synthesis FlgM|nr:flagellar biosynthesis anti-sigma factor FlgM [Pseudomonadota bacterium]